MLSRGEVIWLNLQFRLFPYMSPLPVNSYSDIEFGRCRFLDWVQRSLMTYRRSTGKLSFQDFKLEGGLWTYENLPSSFTCEALLEAVIWSLFDISLSAESWVENEICSSYSKHRDMSVRSYSMEIIFGKGRISPI